MEERRSGQTFNEIFAQHTLRIKYTKHCSQDRLQLLNIKKPYDYLHVIIIGLLNCCYFSFIGIVAVKVEPLPSSLTTLKVPPSLLTTL